jgi:hypothetical protein
LEDWSWYSSDFLTRLKNTWSGYIKSTHGP